ncbi:hypothetical protein D3C71_1679980 [compost metagenome]
MTRVPQAGVKTQGAGAELVNQLVAIQRLLEMEQLAPFEIRHERLGKNGSVQADSSHAAIYLDLADHRLHIIRRIDDIVIHREAIACRQLRCKGELAVVTQILTTDPHFNARVFQVVRDADVIIEIDEDAVHLVDQAGHHLLQLPFPGRETGNADRYELGLVDAAGIYP